MLSEETLHWIEGSRVGFFALRRYQGLNSSNLIFFETWPDEGCKIPMTHQDRWMKWGLFLGSWTLFGLFFSAQQYIFARLYERPMTLGGALLANLTDWYIWAAFSLLIGWLLRHFPLDKKSWGRSPLGPSSCQCGGLSGHLGVGGLLSFSPRNPSLR